VDRTEEVKRDGVAVPVKKKEGIFQRLKKRFKIGFKQGVDQAKAEANTEKK